MTSSYFPVKVGLPKVDYGKGCYIYDADGKEYIDGSGGPAVYALGHAHPEINQAIIEQLQKIAHGYRFTFTSAPWEELIDQLREWCGGSLRQMVFVSSGSEANESAMKIALQYHSAKGQKSRRKFISRRNSYHGNTIGALSLSGHMERREPFEGSLLDVHFVDAVNIYRPPIGVHPENLAAHAAGELEQTIERLGADLIAAFVFEPIVGAAGGCVPAPPGYSAKIREICSRYDILMIADEVMCGSGRTGNWRALEYDGVEPDIMTIAKGLAGGYVPLGAAIYRQEIYDTILSRYERVQTGHTFTSHTLACAAGAAVQRIIKRDGLLEKVQENGLYLSEILKERFAHLSYVGDIRGRGHFWGLELVENKETKEPFMPQIRLAEKIKKTTLKNGLICYPNSGNVDGKKGDHILLAPPYIAEKRELDEIAEKLQISMMEVFQNLIR